MSTPVSGSSSYSTASICVRLYPRPWTPSASARNRAAATGSRRRTRPPRLAEKLGIHREVEERLRGDLRLRHGGGHGADGFVRSHEHVRVDVRLHRLRRARGRDGRHRRNRRGSREERVPARWRAPARLSFASSDRDAAARVERRARETRRAGAGANARAGARVAIDVLPVGRRTRSSVGATRLGLRDTHRRCQVARSAQREKCSLERTHVVGFVLYRFESQPAPRHSERGGRFGSGRPTPSRGRRPPPGRARAGRPQAELRQRAPHRERGGEPEKAQVRAEQTRSFSRASDSVGASPPATFSRRRRVARVVL